MDITRNSDLEQLYKAKEHAVGREKETIEKAMYNIEKSSRNPDIARAREQLIKAHMNHAVDDTYRIEEQIRDLERK